HQAHGPAGPGSPPDPETRKPAAQDHGGVGSERDPDGGIRAGAQEQGGGVGRRDGMKWFLGVILLLFAALVLESGLLAYAMYVLLGVLVLSRVLARSWTENLTATRECRQATAEVGDSVSVTVTVRNTGTLPVPWVLLEDMLPAKALMA